MKRRNKDGQIMFMGKERGNNYSLSLPSKEDLYAETEIFAFRDTCKAALAKQGLENLTILSKYEEACSKAAPHRAADFAKIVDAYTFNAVYGILGGRMDENEQSITRY